MKNDFILLSLDMYEVSLKPHQQAFIYLIERAIPHEHRTYVCRVWNNASMLAIHEWGNLDLILAVSLLHKEQQDFIANILQSVEMFSYSTIEKILCIIAEVVSHRQIETDDTMEAAIVHDAIILVQVEYLHTSTAKALINKKAWMFRMIAEMTRKRFLLR